MAKKRGRPKKLPILQIKEFDRQFREACIPALLVDGELTVLYANDYARAAFSEAERPDGLRALLPGDLQEECVRRIAEKESFRLALPSTGGAVIAVTPLGSEESEAAAGAMVLVTGADRPGEEVFSGDGVSALSRSLREPLSSIFDCLAAIGRKAHIMGADGIGGDGRYTGGSSIDGEGRYMGGNNQLGLYLHSINLASYQLLRNVNNLISYQRGLSGRRGTVEVVDFWARLAPLLDACDIVLHDNDIPFSFSLPEKQFVAHVSCCFGEVEDALMNLISNAYCHSRPGNRVEVIGRNVKSGVVVTVSDLGRGIESEQMDKIFSPFYSVGRDGEDFVGMGMGLTVARQNILMNGGTLAVDSTPGKGTSIAFTLPTCDKPLTPPLVMASGAAQYVLNHFSKLYIGLCDFATLPPQ